MDALSAAGRHEEVAEEWSYLRNTGFAFDSHNWNHLVIALIRAGEVERAFEVVEDVILPYGDASYQALYDAQDRSQGDLGAGEARYSRRIGRMRVFSSDEAQAALKPLLASHALKNADGTDVGFAHELKVLHPLTSPWTAWKPHKRVMKVLGDALLSLEHGDMILPVQGEDMLSLRDVVDNPTHARQLFTRILTKYPTAAKLAYDFRQGNL
ncbi:hypothetical protein FRC18_004125 [Serendipita sp. 400]|nr:hypothetical protein FRC18_004125 [Serendipita sp. 400]